jgi:hypothetical protein
MSSDALASGLHGGYFSGMRMTVMTKRPLSASSINVGT